MKKFRLFLAASSFAFALGAVVITKVNAANADPEYYINNAGDCVPAPVSGCVAGTDDCFKNINATQLNKLIYDVREDGECDEGLHQQ